MRSGGSAHTGDTMRASRWLAGGAAVFAAVCGAVAVTAPKDLLSKLRASSLTKTVSTPRISKRLLERNAFHRNARADIANASEPRGENEATDGEESPVSGAEEKYLQ